MQWFLEKSAKILGKTHDILNNYCELPTNYGKDFFQRDNVNDTKQYYSNMLNQAAEQNNKSLISLLEERLKHLSRVSSFDIDAGRLTYLNSHGDFWISQIIVKDADLTVIDWTSACKLPACLEVIMSYTTSAVQCKDGKIDSEGLKRYINHYSEYSHLSDYDIKIMPYLYYYQQIMCHYPPPYDNIPVVYKPICTFINNFTSWLHENAGILSEKLLT